MKNLTLKNIVFACGGKWIGSEALLEQEISAVTTDSRAVSKNCMFAAIPGERVDGHDFVASALSQGALCAIAEHPVEGVDENIILVENTVFALQAIAAFYRSGFDIPIIGITGSVGKTTAKEMIASVLAQKYCVHKTAGNYNNDLGVVLTLFGLTDAHEAAVVEMGISHPGDMQRLAETVRPTMAVYTVIGHSHLEFLKSREGILAEKSVMNQYLPLDGAVICNGDDDLLAAMECGQKKITFGRVADCAVHAEEIRALPNGSTVCSIVSGERKFPVEISAYGDHMIYAALEGAAVGMQLGLSDAEIAQGIAEYQPVGHRARRLSAEKLTIIDDCYNANPTSVASAIRSLSAVVGRKVCVLGDMLELGENSAALHYETGVLASDCGMDLVLAQGNDAAEIARGAGACGMYFERKLDLLQALEELIHAGDTVLVKASRSMRFEEIVDALLKLSL